MLESASTFLVVLGNKMLESASTFLVVLGNKMLESASTFNSAAYSVYYSSFYNS